MPRLKALEAGEDNLCTHPPRVCAGVSGSEGAASWLGDLDSEAPAKGFPLCFCLAQCPQSRPGARGMLEECRPMTKPRIQGTGPLVWEISQEPEPNYTFISLCYFPVEKSQIAKECVGKVQMCPHYLCDSFQMPCYRLRALPLLFFEGTEWCQVTVP